MELDLSPVSALRGTRILIAEDEILIGLVLREAFSDAGANVVGPCTTLAAALKAAQDEPLSAAVLDVRLGRTSTEEVAARLAERGIPMLFYTGQPLSEEMRAKAPGALVVMKPVRQTALLDKVARLMARH